MYQNKFKTTLLFLTKTFNELLNNSHNLIEQSFRVTQSNLFVYIAPSIPKVVNATKTRPEIRLLANEFYSTSLKLDPKINVVCVWNNENQGLQVKYRFDYELVLIDSKLSGDLEALVRNHLGLNFSKNDIYSMQEIDESLCIKHFKV